MAWDLLYAQSHRRGWTYQDHWLPSCGALGGKPKCSVPRVRLKPTTHRSGVERATNWATPVPPVPPDITPGPQPSPGWRRPSPWGPARKIWFEWGFYALSASKAIFRARTYNCRTYSVWWWWMKLGGNRTPGDNSLLFSISGMGSFICPVASAVHTKAFDYPVAEYWWKPKCSTHRLTVKRATNWAILAPLEDHITPGPQQGGSSPNWGDSW